MKNGHDPHRPPSFFQRVGRSDSAAGWTRIITIIVSIVAPTFIGLAGWSFNHAYNAFDKLQTSVARIDQSMAVGKVLDDARDIRIGSVEQVARDNSHELMDHERRVGALEAQSFYYRNRVIGPDGRAYPFPPRSESK